jgi:hypothetical protein
VNVFPRAGGYVIVLTYGPQADWVRNVLASGGCEFETRGRTWHLTRPRLFRDERRLAVPVPLRLIGGLGDVSDFLVLTRDDGAMDQAGPQGG